MIFHNASLYKSWNIFKKKNTQKIDAKKIILLQNLGKFLKNRKPSIHAIWLFCYAIYQHSSRQQKRKKFVKEIYISLWKSRNGKPPARDNEKRLGGGKTAKTIKHKSIYVEEHRTPLRKIAVHFCSSKRSRSKREISTCVWLHGENSMDGVWGLVCFCWANKATW